MGLYDADIVAGSLMLPESRRLAALLRTHPTEQQWADALLQDNLLQKTAATARRQARLIRKRLTTLDEDGWAQVAEGDLELAAQTIKILSYLLSNQEACKPGTGERRKAIQFFEQKAVEPILLADMLRAVAGNTDVVLFNIDSKADAKTDRDAILQVFLRVFNEMRGSGHSLETQHRGRYRVPNRRKPMQGKHHEH